MRIPCTAAGSHDGRGTVALLWNRYLLQAFPGVDRRDGDRPRHRTPSSPGGGQGDRRSRLVGRGRGFTHRHAGAGSRWGNGDVRRSALSLLRLRSNVSGAARGLSGLWRQFLRPSHGGVTCALFLSSFLFHTFAPLSLSSSSSFSISSSPLSSLGRPPFAWSGSLSVPAGPRTGRCSYRHVSVPGCARSDGMVESVERAPHRRSTRLADRLRFAVYRHVASLAPS